MAFPFTTTDDLFDYMIDEMMAEKLGDDNQSDLSISSVHTADLSDFDPHDFDEGEWSDIVFDRKPEPFTSYVGPKIPLGLDAKPVDYFFQLFPKSSIEEIVLQTNLYAEQQGAINFEKTSVDEIRAYIGMLFLMGINQTPNYRCYWSTKKELRYPPIADVMSRNRYEQLTRYFHLNDSTKNPPRGSPGHDKLHKVRPILENAKRKFPEHYEPHMNIAVDEAMIKYKGRCPFIQYVPSKPSKWGIKAWGIADSNTYYLLDFNIYVRKEKK